MPLFPTAEMMAVAWLKTVDGIPSDKVATSLPGDNSTWAASGFIQVSVAGGTPQSHVPLYAPVIQVDCWANNANSQKPPWGKAGHLAGAIQWATYSQGAQVGVLPMLDDFYDVRVTTVRCVSEPRRIPGDDAGFARVQLDLEFSWTLAEAVIS